MSDVKTAHDAYKLIHKSLGFWIHGAIEDGFEFGPLETHGDGDCFVDELIGMADRMSKLEARMSSKERPDG